MTSQLSKSAFAVAAILVGAGTVAAQSSGTSSRGAYEAVYENLPIILGVVVLAGAMYTILRLFSTFIKMEEQRILREKGLEEVADYYAKPQTPLLAKLWTRLQGAVPVHKEKEILFDHEYDGIRELDNSLPPWWLGLFYLTIIISAVYIYVEHFSDFGLSQAEEYELEMERAQEDIDAYLATQADQIDETNVTVLTSEADLAKGLEIYTAHCVVCHGTQGEGGVGPNFADPYWVHGGDIKDLFRTIKYGVPEKGMISWSALLRPSEMQQVASYILTFQGTDPPNAKEPQGELWTPEAPSEAMLQDSIGG
ncbi:MAG: cbb3-type cytochrome c oxidase N-terminal domain-containing protein [Saprospiraceae bacterium]|nr:cbb3-type cytochrome c oxidase N-terminal domain-containing protein [Saprospiraceae bacterium]